jgi:hypothetical protein
MLLICAKFQEVRQTDDFDGAVRSIDNVDPVLPCGLQLLDDKGEGVFFLGGQNRDLNINVLRSDDLQELHDWLVQQVGGWVLQPQFQIVCAGLGDNGLPLASHGHSKASSCIKDIESGDSGGLGVALDNGGRSNVGVLHAERPKSGETLKMLLDVLDENGLRNNVHDLSISSDHWDTMAPVAKRLGNVKKGGVLVYRLEAVATSQIADGDLNVRHQRDVDDDVLQTDMLGFLGLLGVNNKGDEISEIKETNVFLLCLVVHRGREDLGPAQSGERLVQVVGGQELNDGGGRGEVAHFGAGQHLLNLVFQSCQQESTR